MDIKTGICYDAYVKETINSFFKEYSRLYGNIEPTFVCLGEPKLIGDSLGPIIGSLLETQGYQVYGTITNPITEKNVKEIFYKLWAKTFSKSPVIAIDAAIGNSRIGLINYNLSRGLLPGSGFDKEINPIGNIGIIVTTGRNMNEFINSNKNIVSTISLYIAMNIHSNLFNLRKGILTC